MRNISFLILLAGCSCSSADFSDVSDPGSDADSIEVSSLEASTVSDSSSLEDVFDSKAETTSSKDTGLTDSVSFSDSFSEPDTFVSPDTFVPLDTSSDTASHEVLDDSGGTYPCTRCAGVCSKSNPSIEGTCYSTCILGGKTCKIADGLCECI